MKIDEPKTPYNYYDPELDEDLAKEDFDPDIIALSKKDFTKDTLSHKNGPIYLYET